MPDFLLSEEKKIQRHQRRLTNRDAQAEDREASARWLAQNGTPTGLYALLTRFDMNLTNALNNKDEKDFTYALLVQHGGKSLEKPLKQWLRKCKGIAWPLRLHVDLYGQEATIQRVYELLELERARDDFKPDKKRELLVWLADQEHPDRIEVATPFLADFDEGVRYAAAEVIIGQKDDAGREPLLTLLTNESEESMRLKSRVCEAFAARRWEVDADAVYMPPNYVVSDGRIQPA